jgi:hypothetical protein
MMMAVIHDSIASGFKIQLKTKSQTAQNHFKNRKRHWQFDVSFMYRKLEFIVCTLLYLTLPSLSLFAEKLLVIYH